MSERRLPEGVYRPPYRDRHGVLQHSQTLWIRYSVRGQQHAESARTTSPTIARRLRQQRLGQAAVGQAVGPDVTKTTFADLRSMLIDDYTANGRRSLERAQDAVAHLDSFFNGWRAMNITTDMITRYTRQRQEAGAANSSVNYELALLKRMFRLGLRARRVGLMPYVPMLQVDNARRGFFERDQFDALLDALDDATTKAAVSVAYYTGWRMRSEVLTRQRRVLMR
jgi:hypothetical protein